MGSPKPILMTDSATPTAENAPLSVIVVLLCLAGCAPLAPTYMSESFNIQQVDRIAILPFIDNRAKTNPEHDFELMCNNATDNILQRFMTKGYAASSSGVVVPAWSVSEALEVLEDFSQCAY